MNRSIFLLETPEIVIGRFDHPCDDSHHDPAEELATEFSINRVERGSFDIQIGRHRWNLGPGHVFLCHPGLAYRCRHRELFPTDVCVTVTYRRGGVADEGFDDLMGLGKVRRRHAVLPPTNRLAYLFRAITSLACAKGQRMAAENSATELLAEISAGLGSTPKLYAEHQLAWYAERIDAARSSLDKDYAAQHTLASLAALA